MNDSDPASVDGTASDVDSVTDADPATDKVRFEREAAAFSFKYECQDCAFYDESNRRCTHGYPTLEERRLSEKSPLVEIFCKEFTVG